MKRTTTAALALILIAGCATVQVTTEDRSRHLDAEYDLAWEAATAYFVEEGHMVHTTDKETGLIRAIIDPPAMHKVLIGNFDYAVQLYVRPSEGGTRLMMTINMEQHNRSGATWSSPIEGKDAAEMYADILDGIAGRL